MVKKRSLGWRLVRWVAIFLGGLILLLTLIILLLQTPYGQSVVKEQGEKYLRKKLQTRLSIGTLKINFLSGIHLTNVMLEDQQRKELLSVEKLDVLYDWAGLLKKYVNLSLIQLKGVRINLNRDSVSQTFNYDFINKAFASSDTTTTDDTGFSIHLGKISLDSISFKMNDGFGGQYYNVSLAKFRTDITSSDLDKLRFHANYVWSDGLDCSIALKQTGKTEERVIDTVDVSTPMRFFADTVNFKNTLFHFNNASVNTEVNTKIGNLFATLVDYRSEDLTASARMITLKDHSSEVNMKSNKTPDEKAKEVKVYTPKAFTYYIDSIAIERNQITYNDNAMPSTRPGALDYAHIGLKDLNLHLSDLQYNGKTYSARIHDMAVIEKNGFAVRELRGTVNYSDSVIRLAKFFLKTANNQINLDASVITIPGRNITGKNYLITAGLSSPGLQLKEAAYFQPDLASNKYFRPLMSKSIRLTTNINGSLDNLHISKLTIREASNSISASADILHLPDTKNMVINLRLSEFTSGRAGLLSFLPPGTIPDSLYHYIPETFSVKGVYKGSTTNMYADINLVSSDGNATIKGTIKDIADTKRVKYDLAVTTDNVNLAKILDDTTMGKVTARVVAKGTGFDIKTAVSDYDVHIEEAFYNGYLYRQVNLKGNLSKNTIDANVDSRDPNLNVGGDFFLNMNSGQRGFRTSAEIRNIDLLALGFSNDSIQLRSIITADFPLADSNGMEGNMLIRDTYVTLKGKPISIDTMTLVAVHVADSQSLQFKSPLADLSVAGQYNLPGLGPAFKTIADSYLKTTGSDTVFTTDVKAEYMASIHIPDSIMAMVPGIRSVAPFYILGNIDTKNNVLKLFSSLPGVKTDAIEVDTVNIAFVTQEGGKNYEDMRYAISLGTLTGSSYELKTSRVQGGIKRGIVTGVMELEDDKAKPRYVLPFTFTNDAMKPSIHIGDSLMINKKYWAVNKDNIIYLDTKQLTGSNLTLSSRNTLLELKAGGDSISGLPLTLNIKEFNIKDIAELVITDTAMASGMVNGQLSISSFEPLNFSTNISLDSLSLLKAKLGSIKAEVHQKEVGVLAINTSLSGQNNDVTLNGSYNTVRSEPDLQLDIKQFDLGSLQPILYNVLGGLDGFLRGNLHIGGNIDKPILNGSITTDSLQAIYAMTGTYLRIPKAELGFDEQGIRFNNFDITDSFGNKGNISGMIQTSDYRNLNFDLNIGLTNFEVVGRKKFAQQDIYGPTKADLKLTLRGTDKSALLEGSVSVKEKSLFTYVYRPSTNEELGQGLVEFFDPLKPDDTTVAKKKIGKSTLGFQFLTNLYIHITPSSTVEIMLDETSGDHLILNGNADLNFAMRPGGETSLTGAYQVDGGQYELSLAGLIRRRFKIETGSTINWNGDPLKGNMNITALYETKTAAGPLVNDLEQIPGINKQKLNFEVYIILKNELLKPDIEFRLDMKENEQQAFGGVIYNRIKQVNSIPSELNKQVMGLLAFNQFISENPFNTFTGGGDNFGTQAFNTAGKLLTQELTNVVGKYVKDVDIDIGLEQETDYRTGTGVQRTDLNVGVSKSLAGNRLNVYVGNSFALEGSNQQQAALEGLAGDVTLEYLLTPDGRYRLKGYRITENDITFQGTVVRTGVSFLLVLEFNKFKNAFKKRRREGT